MVTKCLAEKLSLMRRLLMELQLQLSLQLLVAIKNVVLQGDGDCEKL